MTPKCRRGWLCQAAVLAGVALGASQATAQQGGSRVPRPATVTLVTADNVQLRATYYASSAGQEAPVVVMLHDFNETRAIFDPLARALQNPPQPESETAPLIIPRAVIAVDLRGHGESKTAFAPDGAQLELDATRFQAADFQTMATFDMEAVRSFLVAQNDAGALNLNRLCIVGSGMGANLAVLFAANDWAMPPLAVRKQGQDVKALVLLSPRWKERGLLLRDALAFRPVQQRLSIFLAYGTHDRTVAEDCENIAEIFARHHPEPRADQAQALKDFFLYPLRTNLQGTKLLTSQAFDMGPKIADFIEARVGAKQFPYLPRKK